MIDIIKSEEALKVSMELLKICVKEGWDEEVFTIAMKMLIESRQ